MRIVCPNCGEEPQKGQRHLCRPKLAPEAPAKPSPIRSNRVPCATAGSMCASIASLASKNPGLWKSKRSLARSGGDDFVAALLFLAAEHESWTKNSKQALLFSLNLVANEAAMALQRFWRSRCRTKEIISISVTTAAVNGYTAKAATHHGSFRTRRPEPQAPQVSQRKSNPRPVQSRAVPWGAPVMFDSLYTGRLCISIITVRFWAFGPQKLKVKILYESVWCSFTGVWKKWPVAAMLHLRRPKLLSHLVRWYVASCFDRRVNPLQAMKLRTAQQQLGIPLGDTGGDFDQLYFHFLHCTFYFIYAEWC